MGVWRQPCIYQNSIIVTLNYIKEIVDFQKVILDKFMASYEYIGRLMCSIWQCAFAELHTDYSSFQEPGWMCERKLLDRQLERTLTMINDIYHLPFSRSRLCCRAPSCWNSVPSHIIVWLPIPLPHERAALVRRALQWAKRTNKNVRACCRTKSGACERAASEPKTWFAFFFY